MDAGARDSGTPRDAGPACAPERAILPAAWVDVVFVIDRSWSMGWAINPEGDTRWDLLRVAMREVLVDLDPRVSVGAFFFPDGEFCALGPELDVPIAPDHMPRVLDVFDEGIVEGRSPALRACTRAVDALIATPYERRSRFIVLITDGDDSYCDLGSPGELELSVARWMHGVETFVVGVGALVPARLAAYAWAGGRPRPGTIYYRAQDLDSLRQMLREIEDALTGCVFDLPLATTDSSRVTVLVGGVEVPFDPQRLDGWGFSATDRASVSLFGDACARRIDARATVEAIVSCDGRDGG